MSKFYFVNSSFSPNTASGNRQWAFLKLLSQRQIETEVIYFMSDKKQSKAPSLPYIHFHYYWEKIPIRNNKIQTFLYAYLYTYLFCRKLSSGDIVYTYGCNELLEKVINKQGVEVYHERTEHPEVSRLKILNMNKYYDACKRINKLLVISKNLYDYFVNIGVPAEKIEIVNMTVDPSRFIGLQKNTKERYIAYCGKATNNKDGVNELIKSFAIVSNKHPDVKLYIIGTPPKKSDQSGNRELVDSLGLTEKVCFIGEVNSNKIPQILLDAEILALARPASLQANHGFPTKLGEYLLTKNPVVITNVGNITQFLEHKVSAMISEPNNTQIFAENINWLLEHPTEARVIGQNGYDVAIDNFNSDREYNKVISIMFNR